MRYLGELIKQARRTTENEEYGDNEGISQIEIVGYANDAQDMLQGVILRNVPSCDLFDTQVGLLTTNRVRTISLPGDVDYDGSALPVYGAGAVRLVEYSYTGDVQDYYRVRKVTLGELSVAVSDPINQYAILGRKLVLGPTPMSDDKDVRVTYVSSLPRLDLRKGQIDSAATDSITLELTPDATLADETLPFYVSISDGLGNVVQYNILVTAYDSVTFIMTVDPDTPILSPSTMAGNWVTVGKYSTTHPQIIPDEFADRYIIAYLNLKLFNKDSSADAKWAVDEMNQIERDVVGNLISVTKDAQQLPILDWSWLAA